MDDNAHRQPQDWEKKALENLLYATLTEQRRTRRWGIFFKLAFLLYLIVFSLLFWPSAPKKRNLSKPHASLIDIKGMISANSSARANYLAKSLRDAFEDQNTLGIILRINSPGGSPVQSSYVYNEIKRLRNAHPDVKVYAVCTDICASGAYYIASAADEIYANQSTLIGSIGVLINGFGFVDAIHKLGVTRRLITAGHSKGFMDPFSPLPPREKTHIEHMLTIVHQQFIDAVKAGRGARLKDNPSIFSGLAWTGVTAKELGLIDGFKSPGQVARDVIGTEKIMNYSYKGDFFSRLAKKFGSEFGDVVESRLLSPTLR